MIWFSDRYISDNVKSVLKRHGKECQCIACDVLQECCGGISNVDYED